MKSLELHVVETDQAFSLLLHLSASHVSLSSSSSAYDTYKWEDRTGLEKKQSQKRQAEGEAQTANAKNSGEKESWEEERFSPHSSLQASPDYPQTNDSSADSSYTS